jgi:hypothetical protein
MMTAPSISAIASSRCVPILRVSESQIIANGSAGAGVEPAPDFCLSQTRPYRERTYIIAGGFFTPSNENVYQLHQRSYTWALATRELMALDFAKAEL